MAHWNTTIAGAEVPAAVRPTRFRPERSKFVPTPIKQDNLDRSVIMFCCLPNVMRSSEIWRVPRTRTLATRVRNDQRNYFLGQSKRSNSKGGIMPLMRLT